MSPLVSIRVGVAVLLVVLPGSLRAAETLRLQEKIRVGDQYNVSVKVKLSGSLSLPPEKDKTPPKPLQITGESTMEYDERILSLTKDGNVEKTIRVYRRIEFQRKVGEQEQQNTIRPAVRRMVVLRLQNTEIPFSPDGPLLWNELDLVRTDVFTPALGGLLSTKAVGVDDRWNADNSAIQELTDLERVEDGKIECKFDEYTVLNKRKHARISMHGTVRGANEDGPSKQKIDGLFYFDLEANNVTYLSLNGEHLLLDKDGKEVGKITGEFTMTRQLIPSRDLSDEALRGVPTDPRDDLTRLLFDDATMGVRFLYPRRWRVARAMDNQIDLDAADGNGLRITLEPLKTLPSGADFLKESKKWLEDQKAGILKVDPPRDVRGVSHKVEQFSIEIEMNKRKLHLDYFVSRQTLGGATVAARLLPGKELESVRKEVEEIAASAILSKEIKTKK